MQGVASVSGISVGIDIVANQDGIVGTVVSSGIELPGPPERHIQISVTGTFAI